MSQGRPYSSARASTIPVPQRLPDVFQGIHASDVQVKDPNPDIGSLRSFTYVQNVQYLADDKQSELYVSDFAPKAPGIVRERFLLILKTQDLNNPDSTAQQMTLRINDEPGKTVLEWDVFRQSDNFSVRVFFEVSILEISIGPENKTQMWRISLAGHSRNINKASKYLLRHHINACKHIPLENLSYANVPRVHSGRAYDTRNTMNVTKTDQSFTMHIGKRDWTFTGWVFRNADAIMALGLEDAEPRQTARQKKKQRKQARRNRGEIRIEDEAQEDGGRQEEEVQPGDQGEGQEYEVEAIVSKKRMRGEVFYKVRWAGYGAADDTWEPASGLGGCRAMVDEYEAENA